MIFFDVLQTLGGLLVGEEKFASFKVGIGMFLIKVDADVEIVEGLFGVAQGSRDRWMGTHGRGLGRRNIWLRFIMIWRWL